METKKFYQTTLKFEQYSSIKEEQTLAKFSWFFLNAIFTEGVQFRPLTEPLSIVMTSEDESLLQHCYDFIIHAITFYFIGRKDMMEDYDSAETRAFLYAELGDHWIDCLNPQDRIEKIKSQMEAYAVPDPSTNS